MRYREKRIETFILFHILEKMDRNDARRIKLEMRRNYVVTLQRKRNPQKREIVDKTVFQDKESTASGPKQWIVRRRSQYLYGIQEIC